MIRWVVGLIQGVFLNLVLAFSAFYLTSCGDSAFESLEGDSTAMDAVKLLEDQEPERAIGLIVRKLGSEYQSIFEGLTINSNLMTTAVKLNKLISILAQTKKSEFDARNLVSILASAKAQLHGIDPFSVMLAFGLESDSGESNALLKLFPVLPEASPGNLFGISVSITLLNSIGPKNFTSADSFKLGMFIISNLSLTLKAIDTDRNGKVSLEEAQNIDENMAQAMLTQISAAGSAIAATTNEKDTSADSNSASKKIDDIENTINSQEGATSTEKLRNFVVSD